MALGQLLITNVEWPGPLKRGASASRAPAIPKWPCVIPGGNCGKAMEELDGTGLTEFAGKTRTEPERGASPRGYHAWWRRVSNAGRRLDSNQCGASPRGYHAWWRVCGERNRARGKPTRLSSWWRVGGEGNRARGKPTRLSRVVACPWREEPSAGQAHAAIARVECRWRGAERGKPTRLSCVVACRCERNRAGASPRGYQVVACRWRGEPRRGKPTRLSWECRSVGGEGTEAGQAHAAIMCGGVSWRGNQRGASPRGYLHDDYSSANHARPFSPGACDTSFSTRRHASFLLVLGFPRGETFSTANCMCRSLARSVTRLRPRISAARFCWPPACRMTRGDHQAVEMLQRPPVDVRLALGAGRFDELGQRLPVHVGHRADLQAPVPTSASLLRWSSAGRNSGRSGGPGGDDQRPRGSRSAVRARFPARRTLPAVPAPPARWTARPCRVGG